MNSVHLARPLALLVILAGCSRTRVEECKLLADTISRASTVAASLPGPASADQDVLRGQLGDLARQASMSAAESRAARLEQALAKLELHDSAVKDHALAFTKLITETRRERSWASFSHREAQTFGHLMGDCAVAR